MNTIQDLVIQVFIDLFFIFYIGFFAGHAAQRIADVLHQLIPQRPEAYSGSLF